METCKFGADDQKLEGAKRNAFITKCMAKAITSAPGRKVAKKPAAKKPVANKPADAAPPRGTSAADRQISAREYPCRKPIKQANATRPTRRKPRRAFS